MKIMLFLFSYNLKFQSSKARHFFRISLIIYLSLTLIFISFGFSGGIMFYDDVSLRLAATILNAALQFYNFTAAKPLAT